MYLIFFIFVDKLDKDDSLSKYFVIFSYLKYFNMKLSISYI